MTTPLATTPILASSHMDAPLITLDPSANTTDVYAFVHRWRRQSPRDRAWVYPHEKPDPISTL
jgi:hypothetical protein